MLSIIYDEAGEVCEIACLYIFTMIFYGKGCLSAFPSDTQELNQNSVFEAALGKASVSYKILDYLWKDDLRPPYKCNHFFWKEDLAHSLQVTFN